MKKLFTAGILASSLVLGMTVATTTNTQNVQAKTTDTIVSNTTSEKNSVLTKGNKKYDVKTVTVTKVYKSGKEIVTTTVTRIPQKTTTNTTTTTKTSNTKSITIKDSTNTIPLGKGTYSDLSKYNVTKQYIGTMDNELKTYWKIISNNTYADVKKYNDTHKTKIKYSFSASSKVYYRQNNTVSSLSTVKATGTDNKSHTYYQGFTYNTKTGHKLNLSHMFKDTASYTKYTKEFSANLTKAFGSDMPLDMTTWYLNKTGQVVVRVTHDDIAKVKTYKEYIVPNKYLLYFK